MPIFGSNTTDFWTEKAPCPYASGTYTSQTAVVDKRIYQVTPWYPTYTNHLVAYDPSTNIWTEKTPMPVNANSYVVAACLNKIFVMGNPTIDGSLFTQAYDPANDTWEIKTAMPTFRIGMQANVVNDKIYVISGTQTNGLYGTLPINANEVYDPANDSWTKLTPIPTPVAFYASAVFNDKIYIIGGLTNTTYLGSDHYLETYTDLVQIFDPATNQWNQGTPMPTAMGYMAAATITGLHASERIVVVGGLIDNKSTNINQIYNPRNDSWTRGASMPTSRWGLSLANVDDRLYALGGANANKENEQYTPADYIHSPTSETTLTPQLTNMPTQNANQNLNESMPWIIGGIAVALAVAIFVGVRTKKNINQAQL